MNKFFRTVFSPYLMIPLFASSGISLALKGNWIAALLWCLLIFQFATEEQTNRLVALLKDGNDIRDRYISELEGMVKKFLRAEAERLQKSLQEGNKE